MPKIKDLPLLTKDPRPFYNRWQETEGLDIFKGMFVEDLRKVPLKPWKRKGGSGTFINLEGTGGENDAYLCEIPPGGSLLPQKHLYEETIFILDGAGATSIWNEGEAKMTFEWQAGSLFSPPINAWHQHFNTQGDQPVLYIGVTLAPLIMNIFHNSDFIFKDSFQFRDRYNGQQDYFSSEGRLSQSPEIGIRIWETNFVPDVMKINLIEWKERGAGGKSIFFECSENSIAAHMSQFPVGTYKKAHRHGPGAHVIILNGEGYTLMWQEGQPIQRYNWTQGSLIVPPETWFHQHFNVGQEPATYLALHARQSIKYKSGKKMPGYDKNVKEGGDQIEYEDEDPVIPNMFAEELEKRGISNQMHRFESK